METIAFHNEEERSHPISTQDTDEEKKVDEIMAGYARDYEMTCTRTTFDVR